MRDPRRGERWREGPGSVGGRDMGTANTAADERSPKAARSRGRLQRAGRRQIVALGGPRRRAAPLSRQKRPSSLSEDMRLGIGQNAVLRSQGTSIITEGNVPWKTHDGTHPLEDSVEEVSQMKLHTERIDSRIERKLRYSLIVSLRAPGKGKCMAPKPTRGRKDQSLPAQRGHMFPGRERGANWCQGTSSELCSLTLAL
ncbi:hypothetical protein AAFF_G00219010 [Aldrovandia affinis]|uniref:Uncharacterized protein n=1 Tax=Aldrovandia affinis TaxID=143900 RepID=A0AAD7WUL7_9TELE|nr:hypothetical protein AAFF_G00219010 [Aldrovandia affinis]